MGKKSKRKPHLNSVTKTAVQQYVAGTKTENLYSLVEARIGGSVNLRGIGFQLLYSVKKILETFAKGEETIRIRLEGAEDLDLYFRNHNKLFQLKTSSETIDAAKLWNMGVLQNFYEIYNLDISTQFQLVCNNALVKGMSDIFNSDNYTDKQLAYWRSKFESENYEITVEKLKSFLNVLSAEQVNDDQLFDQITVLLLESFHVNIGAEIAYIRALFYHVFQWAKQRQTIQRDDLLKVLQEISDSFSHFSVNEAIKHEWIVPVSYTANESDKEKSGYYDGKAARPVDIALGLNVRRPKWETDIEKAISENGITSVKSSSGQGKSTLIYQVGLNMRNLGQQIYRIDQCSTSNEARQIVDFLESRCRIGEYPIVLIDGLHPLVAAWHVVAEDIQNWPCRILLATREEDWRRFGPDLSRLTVNEVNIHMSESEAKNVYLSLKQRGKVVSSDSWQPAWEKVRESGLLIEYVFLLTQGQMIEERLSHQIKKINLGIDAAAKLEILRLVSLADMLNIRLKTEILTKYIVKHFNLATDRNELYKDLEREYYISFDKKYVQGLHLVRSRHLVHLLNGIIGIETALTALLDVIDEDYVYDYFMNLLIEFPEVQIDEFFPQATERIAQWPLSTMVYAVDGIMHSEPYNFWKRYKETIDAAFVKGGLQLFLYDVLPFNKFNIVETLAEGMSSVLGQQNLVALSLLTKQIPQFEIKDSTVYKFVAALAVALTKRGKIEKYEGIAFLFKWFRRLGITFPEVVEIDEQKLIAILEKENIDESSELFHYYSLKYPGRYAEFLKNNYNTIIGWIKRKTNSLSIYVKDEDIYINYLLSLDSSKINELSVYRINIVHAMLPGHKHYCTKGIALPFPDPATANFAIQSSTKHIPPENLFDEFDVHINQIWLTTIENQYRSESMYEWQKQYYNLRIVLIDLLSAIIKLTEAYLEQNDSKTPGLSNKVEKIGTEWLKMYKHLKRLPAVTNKYFEKVKYEAEEINISKFFSSINAFLNQLSDFFRYEFQFPIYHIKEAQQKLSGFQESYKKIENTFCYFDTVNIVNDERTTVTRLVATIERFRDYHIHPDQPRIVVARDDVSSWYVRYKESRLAKLKSKLNTIEDLTGFHLLAPTEIIEEGSVLTAVIGVEGIDLSSDDFFNLSVEGVVLNDENLGIHFFTFLFINNGKTHYGIRVSTEYFKKIDDALDGKPLELEFIGNPLPVFPDKQLVRYLDNIELNIVEAKKSDEAAFLMLMDIWKLSEYRNRLSREIQVELDWLAVITGEYINYIKEHLEKLDLEDKLNRRLKDIAEQFLTSDEILDENSIMELLNERLMTSA